MQENPPQSAPPTEIATDAGADSRPPAEVPGIELGHRLGSGAYGQVWVGVDENTKRPVAVKFYLHQSGIDWSILSHEVKHLVSLSADRYVVQVLGVGWDATPPYYVMEYVENGSLDDLLRKHGTLAVEAAVELFREIAVGLVHLHGKGILHCDLKPGNILLDQDHRPRLADFGQSRLASDQTPALGTLFYMAPEQAQFDSQPDVRWDVYALGAILYCLLTGAPPYRSRDSVRRIDDSQSLGQRLEKYRELIRGESRPRAHYEVRGIDRALAAIIDSCIHPDAKQRYSNVQEVVNALQARKAARVRRPLMLLGIVGPLVLLSVMIFSLWRSYQHSTAKSSDEIQRLVHENNQFAAQFVAKALEAEIKQYFDIVREEASRPSLHAVHGRARAMQDLWQLVVDPTDRRQRRRVENLDAFLEDPTRQELESYLKERLRHYLDQVERDPSAPMVSSLYVTDPSGTILAIAYADPNTVSKSVGWNYAFRTYFHGETEDRNPGIDPSSVRRITAPHLSAPFPSTTTGLWKLAVSAPITLSTPEESGADATGVIVLALNMGDFEVLRNREDVLGGRTTSSDDLFAVLVDGRRGEREGTILQHPRYSNLEGKIGEWRVTRAQLEQLERDYLYDYSDPLDVLANEQESGPWVAGLAPVRLPTSDVSMTSKSSDNATDLYVLVQKRKRPVTRAVREMGNQLRSTGAWAIVMVVCVTLVLWYIVVRVSGDSLRVAAVPDPSKTESAPVHEMETLAAPK